MIHHSVLNRCVSQTNICLIVKHNLPQRRNSEPCWVNLVCSRVLCYVIYSSKHKQLTFLNNETNKRVRFEVQGFQLGTSLGCFEYPIIWYYRARYCLKPDIWLIGNPNFGPDIKNPTVLTMQLDSDFVVGYLDNCTFSHVFLKKKIIFPNISWWKFATIAFRSTSGAWKKYFSHQINY